MTIEPRATWAGVSSGMLRLPLADGRTIEISLSRVPWLRWLRDASQEARNHWSLEPGGFAMYWDDLDDGVEVRHLLALTRLP